jgi:hypothetical protein
VTINLVLEESDTLDQYTAVGESVFGFNFPVLATDELKVSRDQVLLTYGADYSISGLGDAGGGTITLLGGASTPGEVYTLWLEKPIERLTGFAGGAATLMPEDLNAEFVSVQRNQQMLRRLISNCLHIPADDPLISQDQVLPAKDVRAGLFLAFDADGLPTVASGVGGADTALRTDLASTVSGSDGSRLVGYRRTDASSIGRSVHSVLHRTVFVADFVENAEPGTTDMTAGILAAVAAVAALGGGNVIFPPERMKTTAEIPRPSKVSFIGAGRDTSIFEAAHNGVIVSQINPLVVSIVDDQYAVVRGFGFKASGASTPTHAIKYQAVGFTRLADLRFDASIPGFGIHLQFVLNSTFDCMNISAGTGIKLYSTSVADGCNLNTFTEIATSGCATSGLVMDAHGSYQNEFNTCSFFNQAGVGTAVDHIYACKTRFVNCTTEANLSASMWKLRGGDGIEFVDFSMIDPYKLIDSATFGARNVVFIRPLLWDTDSTTPNLLLHDEITLRDPIYTLDEAGTVGNTHEEHHLTGAMHSTGRQFAHFPGYLNASATAAKSHVTPFGGVIPSGAYNRVGSWDMTNVVQWTEVGTAGATDPFGGTTAYNLDTISNTTHAGFGLGAAATGRTFTFQLWAKFIGRVRLGVGTTVGGIQKFANFYSSYDDWHLLAVTYTSPTDAGTTPFMNIKTDQATVVWRPCHYESFGPLPALQPNRNLASVVGPIFVQDTRITVFGTATPTAGAFTVGDTIEQSVPVVGNPKRWRCTTAGTGAGGTYTSEGNL